MYLCELTTLIISLKLSDKQKVRKIIALTFPNVDPALPSHQISMYVHVNERKSNVVMMIIKTFFFLHQR